MAPIEDIRSKDLSWISEFVMQQFVIMLRPVLEHLKETDAAVDDYQRTAQRLSMEIFEVRDDVERTNKYLSILRNGLGLQNEAKCMMQRTLEATTRTVKRLDEQMEGMLDVMRGIEDSFGQLHGDMRAMGMKHEDMAKQVSLSTSALEDLQAMAERISNDTHSVKNDLLSSEARHEVLQGELRELRRNALGMDKMVRPPPSSSSCRAPVADSWPQKKNLADVTGGGDRSGAGSIAMTSGVGDTNSNCSGSSQSKRISRVGSSSGRLQMHQDHLDLGVPTRSASKPTNEGLDYDPADERPGTGSRLPCLATKPAGASRAPQRGSAEEPSRLRFSATMAKPPSRGTPG
mmetsp:Transcript_20712/g.44150  ORF Transcript_20712/g.44150 Transcript_20712/m.44150 type:complete len:346 (+) Transcript_20712:143-1180(+)